MRHSEFSGIERSAWEWSRVRFPASPFFASYDLLFGIFLLFEPRIFGLEMLGKNFEGAFETIACKNRKKSRRCDEERGRCASGDTLFVPFFAIFAPLPFIACMTDLMIISCTISYCEVQMDF
jgi:hypothetical protein